MLEKLKKRLAEVAQKTRDMQELAQAELNKFKISEEDRNARMDICRGCEHLFEPTTTCKKCGCFMAAKTYIPSADCPIGKWPVIQINVEK